MFGFAFDYATLRRVDDVGDNLQLTLYLLGAGALLILERRAWHGRCTLPVVRRRRELARFGVQFFFGGLCNAYFIFFTQSATLGPALGFSLVLVVLMLGNELLWLKLRPDAPQIAMWFFSALSYLLFAIPTWTAFPLVVSRFLAAGVAIGLTSGLTLLIHLGPVVDPLPPRLGDPSRLSSALARGLVTWTAILGGLVLLAELGAIPPVPLALAEAGIFRDVRRDGGRVALTFEPRGLWPSHEPRFLYRPGDRVFCFTAIFAPRGAELALAHTWERLDPTGRWVETDRIPWTMHGGRDGGWRSWTAKSNVSPGEWRVRVLTEDGIEVGRVRFSIETTDLPPAATRVRTY